MTSYAEARISNPARYFDTPDSVQKDTRLSPKDKEKVLKSMAVDADLKAEATAEGMAGAKRGSDANELQSAQIQLKQTKAVTSATRPRTAQFQRIMVVTSDNQPLNQEIAQTAFSLAKKMDGKVYLFNLVPMLQEGAPLTAAGPMVASTTLNANENTELVDERYKQLAKLATGCDENIAVEIDVRTGPIEQEVVEYAKDCAADLIVVGSPNRSWLEALLETSLTNSVTKYAPCPVLVVPETA